MRAIIAAVCVCLCFASLSWGQAPAGGAFTFQGLLQTGSPPVNFTGAADVQCRLFASLAGGSQIGPTLASAQTVTNGVVTVPLDFGPGAFDGTGRWLEVSFRSPPGSGAYTTLSPRQAITAAPIATSGVGFVGLPGDAIDQSQTVAQGFYNTDFTIVQTFCVAQSGALVGLDLLFSGTSAGGAMNVSILSGATPIAATTATVPAGGGPVHVTFAAPPQLTAGQTYRISFPNNAVARSAIAVNNSYLCGGIEGTVGEDIYFRTIIHNDAALLQSSRPMLMPMIGGTPGAPLSLATFASNGAATVGATLDQLQNLGVGRGSVGYRLDVYRDAADGNVAAFTTPNTYGTVMSFVNAAAGGHNFTFLSTGPDYPTGAGKFVIRDVNSATDRFCIDAAGNVGINTNNPTGFNLIVNGTAAKPGGGTWAVFSDSRLKHDIAPMKGTLDRLLKLHGYSFEYNADAVANRLALPGSQLGLLADEVEQVFPDWVGTDNQGYRYVTERSTTALMVEALRDLKAEKDTQLAERDRRIEKLATENADLKARLDRLERRVSESLNSAKAGK
jgi:hypothetical protein